MSNTRYYKGQYFQGSLSDERAEMILELINNYEVVTSLKHIITEVPDFMITEMKWKVDNYISENGNLDGFDLKFKGNIPNGTLQDYQTIGVAFMYYSGSSLLGDEVGLGKTVQIAGLVNLLRKEYENNGKEFRYLFLAEKTSSGQIQDKLMKFTGEYVGLLPDGGQKSVSDYIELNKNKKYYSVVGTHSLLLNPEFITYVAKKPFDLIIVDESRILKNVNNEYYNNAKAIFKFHSRKILLNATPVEIKLRDLYNQLALLDKDYMPTVTEFGKRFLKFKKTMFGFVPNGHKNEEEFKEAIKLRYIARTRAELGAEYRNNVFKTILVPQSPTQKALNKKTSLKQMVIDYPTGVDRHLPFNEDTTPKLAALLKIIEEEVLEYGEQVLVYCYYKEAQSAIKEILEEKGISTALLNGSTRNRTEISADFNNGVYSVLLTNVLRGIDLNSCNIAVLYSIDPNPQNMVQFEGRITREFNVEGKSVILLVSMGTEKKFVEEKLKMRVDTSDAFTTTGRSMIKQAIKTGENKEMFQYNLEFSPEDDDK